MKPIRLLSILVMIAIAIPSLSFAQKEKDRNTEKANWRAWRLGVAGVPGAVGVYFLCHLLSGGPTLIINVGY